MVVLSAVHAGKTAALKSSGVPPELELVTWLCMLPIRTDNSLCRLADRHTCVLHRAVAGCSGESWQRSDHLLLLVD